MSTTRLESGTATRLSDPELHAWRGMLEVTRELRSRFDARLQAVSSLSEADYTVLLALVEAGDRALRSSELADAISWERSRLSHHLGRMERRGLLRRDECPTDSRGADLRITEAGTAAIRTAAGPHLREIKSLFADALTAEQVDTLAEIVDALAGHLASVREAGESR